MAGAREPDLTVGKTAIGALGRVRTASGVDQLPVDPLAQGCGVPLHGRELGVDLGRLETGDSRLRGVHAGCHDVLRQAERLALSGEPFEELSAPDSGVQQCGKLWVRLGALRDHLVKEVLACHVEHYTIPEIALTSYHAAPATTGGCSALWNDGSVQLCPVCFNAPAYCERETPYELSADGARRSENRPSATAERETEERLLRRPTPSATTTCGRSSLGSSTAERGSRRRLPWSPTTSTFVCQFGSDPLGFFPPINRSTGRIEFHDESYPVAEQLRLGHHFARPPAGDKAAITPKDAEEVQAILALARAVLAGRRASG